MIIYNVTTKIDLNIHDIWFSWMKEEHIPKVIATGCFVNYKMYRILEEDTRDGISYAVQYFANTINDYFDYKNNYATQLQSETKELFSGKFVAHRTLLREV
jgi:type IV secretory pathway VirB6-like protein